MIVGGSDLTLKAPRDAPVGDLILRRIRVFWPDSWFQDAGEDDAHSIHDSLVDSKEFFIYRDRPAVEDWEREGATPANLDTMLYFTLGEVPAALDEPREITLVCGARTEQIERLVDDLETSFRSSQFPALGV